MSTNKRAVHAVRGFSLPLRQVRRAIQEGSLIWVVENETFRDTTPQEAWEVRAREARAKEYKRNLDEKGEPVWGTTGEVGGCRFIRPATTDYRSPRAAYEAMYEKDQVLFVKTCHWPREAGKYAESCA